MEKYQTLHHWLPWNAIIASSDHWPDSSIKTSSTIDFSLQSQHSIQSMRSAEEKLQILCELGLRYILTSTILAFEFSDWRTDFPYKYGEAYAYLHVHKQSRWSWNRAGMAVFHPQRRWHCPSVMNKQIFCMWPVSSLCVWKLLFLSIYFFIFTHALLQRPWAFAVS